MTARRHVLPAALALFPVLFARPCTAQAGAFLGGGVLVARTSPAAPDPEAYGYLVDYFHGDPEGPVFGVWIDGGGFVAKRWSVGGELAWHARAEATAVTQSRGHFDFISTTGTLARRETLASAIVRLHAGSGRSIDVQPAGGLTISSIRQSFTNAQGVVTSPPFPTTVYPRSDVFDRRTRWGVAGGADVAFRVHAHVQLVATARLHRMFRSPNVYTRTLPGPGNLVTHAGVSVRWVSTK